MIANTTAQILPFRQDESNNGEFRINRILENVVAVKMEYLSSFGVDSGDDVILATFSPLIERGVNLSYFAWVQPYPIPSSWEQRRPSDIIHIDEVPLVILNDKEKQEGFYGGLILPERKGVTIHETIKIKLQGGSGYDVTLQPGYFINWLITLYTPVK